MIQNDIEPFSLPSVKGFFHDGYCVEDLYIKKEI